jgi:hypothetical protein
MELPTFDTKKRSRSTDDGGAAPERPRWHRATLVTTLVAGAILAAVKWRHPPPPPPPLEPGQILTCGLRHRHVWPFHNPPAVASDLVVSLTTLPQRSETLPLMLKSLAAGWTVPKAIYVVDGGDHARPNECPSYLSRHRGRHFVDVHFVRAASDRGPIEKYIGAVDAIRKTRKKHWWTRTRFLLVLDDDHVYKRHIVERYAAALRAEPDTVFTVQSPPSQFIGWRPRINVAYGARGVGMRLDLALDGALNEYAAAAARVEPTCRVVDDIVVSAFFASRNVTVRDVPYFSFDNRPWRHVNQIRLLSKQHALRSDKRDAQNARCHDALVGRDATASGSAAQAAAPSARRTGASGGPARGRARTSAIRPSMQLNLTAHAGAKHAKRRNSIRHHV